MTKPAISLNPDPPKGGQPCVITYTGTTPATIHVTFEPPGVSYEYTVTADGLEIDIPKTAYTMTVTDASGAAPGRDVPVA